MGSLIGRFHMTCRTSQHVCFLCFFNLYEIAESGSLQCNAIGATVFLSKSKAQQHASGVSQHAALQC